MKNVTISMDEATLAWVRVEAARAGVSVSRWIGEILQARRGDSQAKSEAWARIEEIWRGPGIALSENGKINIDRDEMYGERFRRFDHAPLSAGQARSGEGSVGAGMAEEAGTGRQTGDEPSGSE
jgi:hypothetical protein